MTFFNTMRAGFLTGLCLSVAVLNGCASSSVYDGYAGAALQKVVIHTPGVSGANCLVQAGPHRYSVTLPGAVQVHRGPYPLDIKCFKGRHMNGHEIVLPTMSARDAANIPDSGKECRSCLYPSAVTVSMSLASQSFHVNLRQGP